MYGLHWSDSVECLATKLQAIDSRQPLSQEKNPRRWLELHVANQQVLLLKRTISATIFFNTSVRYTPYHSHANTELD